ncbi:hypothetical protein E1I18_00735 [Mycoplasmopsis mucosicanis]|uniref:Uncharacterized protein n=1 Tax=Mycoplasmopsis mucosicanis TaxID=458208 RepID=A0A507SSQ0_9BACT|nr:hypothetical protein [Mycoplasmopsis mucosicanis]TQC54116.1 hypothetical protein E1I18_00735 [Mycoplasmopsis mucosicanis]
MATTLYPRTILQTSYKNYLSKYHSLNLYLDDKNNYADWHHINMFYSNKPNQIIDLSFDKYNLGKKGILKRKLTIFDKETIYYVASYARAMFEWLHDFSTLRIYDIKELMFEKPILKELLHYFQLHNCNLCKQYLECKSQWD